MFISYVCHGLEGFLKACRYAFILTLFSQFLSLFPDDGTKNIQAYVRFLYEGQIHVRLRDFYFFFSFYHPLIFASHFSFYLRSKVRVCRFGRFGHRGDIFFILSYWLL